MLKTEISDTRDNRCWSSVINDAGNQTLVFELYKIEHCLVVELKVILVATVTLLERLRGL